MSGQPRGRSLNPDIANSPRPNMFQTAKYLAWILFFAIASAPPDFQGAEHRSARPVPSWHCHRACEDAVPSRVLPQFCLLVNLICPSLGECSAYNVPTTHGSEHTCPSKGSSTSPFVDCLCKNITQSSVLRKAKNGSDIDAQRDASCTRNAARLRHLYASDPLLSVPRAPVDTKLLRTGLGVPTRQCRPLTAAYGRSFFRCFLANSLIRTQLQCGSRRSSY